MLAVGDEGSVRFAHPLLASAVYFGRSPARRRAVHAALVDHVEGIEQRARHVALAQAGPDEDAAALLERAAEAAAGRGALDAAAALAAEAVRLTPADHVSARDRRLIAGASHLVEIGEFAAARRAVEPLLGPGVPQAVRAAALLLAADAEIADRRRLVELLEAALAAAGGDAGLRWQALIRLAQHAGWVSGDSRLAVAFSAEGLAAAIELDEAGARELSTEALALFETARGVRGPSVPAAPASRRQPLPRLPWWQYTPRLAAGSRLMWAGELEQARSRFADELEEVTQDGREARAGFVLTCLGELEWLAGRWQEARRLADEATARLGDINPTAVLRLLSSVSAGDAEGSRAVAAGVLAYAERSLDRVSAPKARWALGLLELSLGDPERAWAELEVAAAVLDDAGIRNPGVVPLGADVVEALVALGRLEQAERAAARLEAVAAALAHRWAGPAAGRARALVLLAGGEARAAATAADEAAAEAGAGGFPFDRARALLVGGEALRRLGERRSAAERLTAAAAAFADLGAPLWRGRAERELRRASPRRGRGAEGLTAAETRVATLVAAGRTNKETAAELFTTVATVEAHLTRIYRKLGIRSRSELAGRVADGTLPLDP